MEFDQTSRQPPGPRILIVRALEACNAGCFMCAFRWSSDAYRLSEKDAQELAARSALSTIRLARFTGGEPLIHKHIAELVAAFSDRHVLTSIITNGAALARKSSELVAARLSQIIVSIDGVGHHHDGFRNTPGLFASGMEGIARIKTLAPATRTRVNTVVGPHNFEQLISIYDCLREAEVQSWSIIPLKTSAGVWPHKHRVRVEANHEAFIDHIASNPGVRILGHGLHWFGRDHQEREDFFLGRKCMTPRGRCELVHAVRYVVPSSNKYFLCNCLPHRAQSHQLEQPLLEQPLHDRALTQDGSGAIGEWLAAHGPYTCTGCEPVNAFIGENVGELDLDIFSF